MLISPDDPMPSITHPRHLLNAESAPWISTSKRRHAALRDEEVISRFLEDFSYLQQYLEESPDEGRTADGNDEDPQGRSSPRMGHVGSRIFLAVAVQAPTGEPGNQSPQPRE